MQQNETSALQKSENTAIEVLPADSSIGQLLSTEEANLISLSSVNSAIKQLHEQMESLAPEKESNEFRRENERFQMYRANTVVATASALGRLVRLKVDSARMLVEMRKQREKENRNGKGNSTTTE